MNLSAHFTDAELTASAKAVALGIDNTPSVEILDSLHTLAGGLERVRAVLGAPIRVSSGYRSPKLNRALKGAKNSAHMLGLAADFTAPGFGDPLAIVKAIVAHKDLIGFEQVINEGTWVHVSFPEEGKAPALEVLTAHFGPAGTTYTKGV